METPPLRRWSGEHSADGGVCWEGALHLWGAQGAADPSVGAGGIPGVPAGYSDPAHYEFLWGPRAYAETRKQQVMAFVLGVRQRALRAFPLQSAEAAREEDKEA